MSRKRKKNAVINKTTNFRLLYPFYLSTFPIQSSSVTSTSLYRRNPSTWHFEIDRHFKFHNNFVMNLYAAICNKQKFNSDSFRRIFILLSKTVRRMVYWSQIRRLIHSMDYWIISNGHGMIPASNILLHDVAIYCEQWQVPISYHILSLINVRLYFSISVILWIFA